MQLCYMIIRKSVPPGPSVLLSPNSKDSLCCCVALSTVALWWLDHDCQITSTALAKGLKAGLSLSSRDLS